MYLNVRTDYSFLRAYGTIDQVVGRAKDLGHKYLGIADFLSTWGHIKFYDACLKADIKPLLGAAFPVTKDLSKDPRYDLFTVIAKTDKGLSEIYKLIGTAHAQKYYRGRITYKQLYDLEDVYIICDYVAMQNLNWLNEDVILAVSPKPGVMMNLAKSGEYETVFAPAPLYPKPNDKTGYEILTRVSQGTKNGELPLGHGAMVTEHEAREEFKKFGFNIGAEIATANVIANHCNAKIRRAKNVSPDSKESVEEWARRGADERGLDVDQGIYARRLERELDIIREKDFEDYFLLVADVVRFAKDHMLVGPGRGSAGGSLICYLMGITELDPIVHGTLFERFIDPTRNDYPDIDIDFPDAKRHLVFEYLQQKYGQDRVAKIGTVAVLKTRSAINDMARALSLPFDAVNQISAAMTDDDTISSLLAKPEMESLVQSNPKIKNALLLEGHVRHHGVHAAGVCISKNPVTEFASIDHEGVAALTLDDAEQIGLLKMDALGLRSLSVIEECCDLANLDAPLLMELEHNDPEVWKVFNEDRVAGIFQFEGMAVRGLMKKIEIDRFTDLCALTSLARPGPLIGGAAEEWVKRRAPGSDWEHFHESMSEITENTFGTIVYQEQVMRIAQDVAGFDIGDVNKLRKAIGKKIPEELFKFREKFVAGAGNRMHKNLASVLWDQIETFGGYAFNYSHAVAYSMISYIMAYLKAYHPLEFAVAQLRHQDKPDKCKALLRELIDEGYDFIPFDHQHSGVTWSFSENTIYGGFTSVKGVGQITAEKFVAAREQDPEGWVSQLTPVQRKRLLSPNNTPWHDIDRIQRRYADLYRDPANYRTERLPRGCSAKKIWRIGEIPEEKGTYFFIGTLTRKALRDKNSPDDVNKRDGQKIPGPSVFLNMYFEDDTGDCGSTVSRFKYEEIGQDIWEDPDAEGRDYLVKGNIIEDGRKWLFIEKLVEISNDKRLPDPNQTDAGGIGQSDEDCGGHCGDSELDRPSDGTGETKDPAVPASE